MSKKVFSRKLSNYVYGMAHLLLFSYRLNKIGGSCKIFWITWKYLPKILASLWENNYIRPPCSSVLVMDFCCNVWAKINLKLVFLAILKGMLRRNIDDFLKKTHIWKIRIFWNELIVKNIFFYFQRSVPLIFLKIWILSLYFIFGW